MGGFWKVRTELSDCNWIIVHSLRRQRTNQETDLGAQPLRTRIVVACYTQKRSAFLLKRTRLSQSADFAFAASKRTAKTEEFLREERIFFL